MTAPPRVLVVEDDTFIMELIREVLTDEGYELMTAAHGGEALTLVGKSRPDLILLDVHMPVMNGLEFLQAYRQTPAPHAPVILLTAGRDAIGALASAEAAGTLTKPFQLDDLLAVVRHYTQ